MKEETPEEFAELAALVVAPPPRTRDQKIRVRCDDSSHQRFTPVVGELLRDEHNDNTFSWFFFGREFTAEYRRELEKYRQRTGTHGALSHMRFRGNAIDPNTGEARHPRLEESSHNNGCTKYVDQTGRLSQFFEWEEGTSYGGIPSPGTQTTPLPPNVHKTFDMKCPLCRAPLRVREPRIRPQLEIAWKAHIRELSLERIRRWSC